MTRVGQIYRDSLVKTIKNNISENKSVFLLSYTKLSSPKISELRKDLKKVGASVHVAKNQLARLALKELNREPLAEKVEGQTAFVWSSDDAVAISKVLMKFTKEIETLKVRGGILDDGLLADKDVKTLSELPSREVLLAQLLGILQAPISRLLGAFNAKSQDLLSILKQYSEKKGGNK
jgi:large subunit ribosomal protein L10